MLALAACDTKDDTPDEPTPAASPDSGSGGGSGSSDLSPSGDEDGDGLSNREETLGWAIEVDTDGYGERIRRTVTSDPLLADTDGDGLTDRDERSSRTDPNSNDTDGDGLTDRQELLIYQSNPNFVDTDRDSRGPNGDQAPNPSLFDGNEINRFGTSPVVADTDGDGLTDYDEIISRGRNNARVADVPVPRLQIVGEPNIALHVTYTENVGTESTYGTSFAQSSAQTSSKSGSMGLQTSVEVGTTVSGEANFGIPASASVSTETSVSTSVTAEASSSWSQEASQSLQEQYEAYQEQSRDLTEESSSGEITISVRIKNEGDITFRLLNMKITVLQVDPNDPTLFRTLAELEPSFDAITLAPGETSGRIAAGADDLDASLIKGLMAQPTGLVFEVASFDIEDEEGNNFAWQKELTSANTGVFVIDYGGGSVERYLIATAVERDPFSGDPIGVTMAQVLGDILKMPYETTERVDAEGNPTGVTVLTQVNRTRTDPDTNRFWVVVTSDPDQSDDAINFEDIVLESGEQVYLAFMRDQDRDGLYAREEALYRTSDVRADSDNDGLTDFEEVKGGWLVTAPGPTYPATVFANPLVTDTDADGLNDADEMRLGADPNRADTDGDGLLDAEEARLLTDPASEDTDDDGLSDWDELHTVEGRSWITDPINPDTDGDGMPDGADSEPVSPWPRDVWVVEYGLDGPPYEGRLSNSWRSGGPDLSADGTFGRLTDRWGNAEAALWFRAEPAPPAHAYANLSLGLEQTVEMELGPVATEPGFGMTGWLYQSTWPADDTERWIMGERGWARLTVRNGLLSFQVPTADGGLLVLEHDQPLPEGEWVFVAGVVAEVDGEYVARLYVDGRLAQEAPFAASPPDNSGACGWFFLGAAPPNDECASEFVGVGLDAALDDVNVFRRGLKHDEIWSIYRAPDWYNTG